MTHESEHYDSPFYYNGSEFCCHGCGYDLMDWDGDGPPTCYDCNTDDGISVGHYVMKGGQYCDGEKRIMALPGNHPDAHPESKADAERIMKKHGIDCDTGFWKDDAKKEAAMKVAKQRKPEKTKEKSRRTH